MLEPTKKYIKVPVKVRSEIRTRYELGEDLSVLAREYKVNYGTLKNYASNKNWIKGSRAEVIYLKQQENLEKSLEEELRKVDSNHKYLYAHWLSGMSAEAKQTDELKKGKEEARSLRIKSLDASLEFSRKLFNIKSSREQLEYDIKEQEYKLLKQKVDKATEIKNKTELEEEFKG